MKMYNIATNTSNNCVCLVQILWWHVKIVCANISDLASIVRSMLEV